VVLSYKELAVLVAVQLLLPQLLLGVQGGILVLGVQEKLQVAQAQRQETLVLVAVVVVQSRMAIALVAVAVLDCWEQVAMVLGEQVFKTTQTTKIQPLVAVVDQEVSKEVLVFPMRPILEP
jgi:hypothetical protein